jgi:hypothetical protein
MNRQACTSGCNQFFRVTFNIAWGMVLRRCYPSRETHHSADHQWWYARLTKMCCVGFVCLVISVSAVDLAAATQNHFTIYSSGVGGALS